MSSFGGVMNEFPDVRVDYFRQIPGLRPPLACFLSHVHSDHLVGLESFKSPFVYCSAATRELLLRLERYPHRLNFASGLLESRVQQYKHLRTLLKPIPLETPTVIELAPGNEIQVTFFDANHCTGSVMFLFEGNGKAVLYTGDIRSEPWFVNALCSNPFLIEYTSGLKTLDCIYLDTSNIAPIEFPTKAAGLKELLQKVSAYPADTIFHFAAWTFGYEEVWMVLSRALRSPIHVDRYKLRLYQSLRGEQTARGNSAPAFIAHDAPVLAGYTCGNAPQRGCLTGDPTVRIHSCEKGMHCAAINDKTVWIRPIIARTVDGSEIPEIGIGGGGGDLAQRPELFLEDASVVDHFLALFASIDDATLRQVKQLLSVGIKSKGQAISLDDMGFDRDEDELTLVDLTTTLIKRVVDRLRPTGDKNLVVTAQSNGLPKIITFPYSRHSSYFELCHLVSIFKPKDVYPCTVDEENWHEGISIQTLFGAECSGTVFRHDQEMWLTLVMMKEFKTSTQETETTRSQPSQMLPPATPAQINASTSKDSGAYVSSIAWPGSASSEHRPTETPPLDLSTISPCSASQNLRRKAIVEGLSEGPNKRACLDLDGASFSAIGVGAGRKPFAEGGEPVQPSNLSGNPPQKASSPGIHEVRDSNSNSMPHDQVVDEREQHLEAGSSNSEQEEAEMVPDSFFDSRDQVLRCNFCGHEVWRDFMGFCTGCEMGLSGIPYFETPGPTRGSRHGVALDEFSEELEYKDKEERRRVVGDYMDDHSSAYDSQDSNSHLDEEYEINSFIDENEDIRDHSSEDEPSSADETDYKAKYLQLHDAHNLMMMGYDGLALEFREFRHDCEIFTSDDNVDEDDDMGEIDEDGILLVNVAAPDPILSEVILSQGEDVSQVSSMAGDEATPRLSAVMSNEDEENVDETVVTLTSAGGNHTFPETEL